MALSSYQLVSWNVNGIRAAQKNGFLEWLGRESPDVVCLQEIKAFPDQLDPVLRDPKGYVSLWNSAQKPGYSGTAIYSKRAPQHVQSGMGIKEFDDEGRVLVAEFPEFVLINVYFPNSQRDHARLDFKLRFCQAMLKFCEDYRKKGRLVILSGDFNIAHKEIDLKNPKANMDNAGFLPEERAWLDQFVAAGYVDSFREFSEDPGQYTWWSYRPGVREKNIGWRLDYHFVNQEGSERLVGAEIHPQVPGSDHCPVSIKVRK